ncbi:glycine zipper domain-containing protein [Pseudodesulfovibrio sediminis]|uniref:Glycine zipper domain-containing protein n=1 Tax=Pseudodesulfovibrio sediminis TaxID=2810563 RepID=A0ABM7P6T9_9BACT|nr:glycine zipper domain-containing protein [Pseudodesulfovibrio sediminis]BCS88656.1 hypothetical protein PSDVSF_18980 [Pseudodesulfovibrio sediminis]
MRKILIPLLLICFMMVAYGCANNRAQQGAAVGGLAGATIGALTFNDKLLGAAVGAGVGTLMGYIVGNEWDKADEQKVQQTLEQGRSNEPAQWTNPDTGRSYTATPTPPYVSENKIYRDVTIKSEEGQEIMAKAWRDDQGVWHLKQ